MLRHLPGCAVIECVESTVARARATLRAVTTQPHDRSQVPEEGLRPACGPPAAAGGRPPIYNGARHLTVEQQSEISASERGLQPRAVRSVSRRPPVGESVQSAPDGACCSGEGEVEQGSKDRPQRQARECGNQQRLGDRRPLMLPDRALRLLSPVSQCPRSAVAPRPGNDLV